MLPPPGSGALPGSALPQSPADHLWRNDLLGTEGFPKEPGLGCARGWLLERPAVIAGDLEWLAGGSDTRDDGSAVEAGELA